MRVFTADTINPLRCSFCSQSIADHSSNGDCVVIEPSHRPTGLQCAHSIALLRTRMKRAIETECGISVNTVSQLIERAVSFDKLLTIVTYEASAIMWEHWKELAELVAEEQRKAGL